MPIIMIIGNLVDDHHHDSRVTIRYLLYDVCRVPIQHISIIMRTPPTHVLLYN